MIMVEFGSPNNVSRPAGHYASHHGSPHLQHLERPSAHSTPSPTFQSAPLPHMYAQQQPTLRSTPTSYPSPSFPSPSMPAYQQYPARQTPSSRGSPYPTQGAPVTLPPILLPQPHSGSMPGSPLPGSPLPPAHAASMYYQGQVLPPTAGSHHITSAPISAMRYALPPNDPRDNRVMSGGRHKKEIKRRTKTGCLTCRKRRIKCDEGHPTCKNCTKSKRDCLGYDPIFKSQAGPPPIQPAPQQAHGGQMMQEAQPVMYGMPVTTLPPPYMPNCATAGNSPAPSSCDSYDYHTPQIDPALDSTSLRPMQGPTDYLEAQTTYRPELKRTMDDRTSPFSSASDTSRPLYPPIPRSDLQSHTGDRRDGESTKRIKIGDLLSVGSIAQPPSPPNSELATNVSEKPSPVETMKSTFKDRFAVAVDGFLEVNWYKTIGTNKLCSDVQLQEKTTQVFERLKARGGSYVEEEDPIIVKAGAEADLLWAAVEMTYGTRIPVADTRKDGRDSEDRALKGPIDGDLDSAGKEAFRRIGIVQSLLAPTGETNASSSQQASPPPKDQSDASDEFWDLIEEIKDFRHNAEGEVKTEGSTQKNRLNELLSNAEKIVDGRKNRKLLLALAELHNLRPCADPANDRLLTRIRSSIEEIAKDTNASTDSLEQRIAGRALGLWKEPILDVPCCMSPTSPN